MSENYVNAEIFSKVSESIKSVFDITSRIDERVKIIIERQSEQDRKIMQLVEHVNNLTSRVVIIESKDEHQIKIDVENTRNKVHDIEHKIALIQFTQQGQESKWKGVMGFGLQLLLAILSAYMIYRLGFQNNP